MKVEDIIESLNFEAPIVWKGNIGSFTVNDNNFIVTVRPASPDEEQTFIPFFPTLPKVGNVDFSAILPDGTPTQDLTGMSGGTAMKVFSVVAQGVAEQVKQHGYDILLCIAKQKASPTNYQNRVRAYETIVERAARKAGRMYMLLVSTPSETIFVVYKYPLMDNMLVVKQHLTQHYQNT